MATTNLADTLTEQTGIYQDWAIAGETITAGQPVALVGSRLFVATASLALYKAAAGVALSGAKVGQRCWYATPGAELVVSGLTSGEVYHLAAGTNEVQTVQITGTPTGGTFRLSFGGVETSNLAFDIAAAALQTALVALSTIGTGNIAITGSNPNFTATFKGTLAATDLALLVLANNSLTGGVSPSVAIAQTTAGARGGGLAPRADLVAGHYLVVLGYAPMANLFKLDLLDTGVQL